MTSPRALSLSYQTIQRLAASNTPNHRASRQETVNHKDYDSRESFEDAMLETLKTYDIDLICLAGFMRILTPTFYSSLAR